MEEVTTDDEATLHVDREDARTGSEADFYVVYADADGRDPWGYLCGNCDSLETAMDTMGRIVCNGCGNTRKPEEWDAAHE